MLLIIQVRAYHCWYVMYTTKALQACFLAEWQSCSLVFFLGFITTSMDMSPGCPGQLHLTSNIHPTTLFLGGSGFTFTLPCNYTCSPKFSKNSVQYYVTYQTPSIPTAK